MTREQAIDNVMTEADTCRELVTPKIVQAGWSTSPFAIGEQRTFTYGRIFVAGGKVRRGRQRRADYILFYRRDFPLAVVEAKEASRPAETGVQQAREYTKALGLKFAYATNGYRFIEIDYLAGTEREVSRYATPDELFARLSVGANLPPALAKIRGGTNARRRRLQPASFLNYEMPVPSMAKQLELWAIYQHTQSLEARHAAIREANAALLPATLERVFQTEIRT